MQWLNSEKRYGWATIILHWLTALLVLQMLLIGWTMAAHAEAGDRAARAQAMFWHMSFGVLTLVVVLTRVVTYYRQKRPEKPAQSRPLQILATATHHTLLLGLLLLVISGPLTVWTAGRDVAFFNLFTLPTPFARNQSLHEVFETLHAIGRLLLYIAIPLHVLGVLKHMILDRDGVLRRMIWPSELKKPAA